jgi:hypothetical protein
MTTRFVRAAVLTVISAACLSLAPGWAQAPEALDTVSEDIDLLRQINVHGFTTEQLRGLAGALQELATARTALADYKAGEAALGPMRALREALLQGEPTAEQEEAVQEVWDKLSELDTAVEDATREAGRKLAALLTDEQLTQLTEGQDIAYEQADSIFADLEAARAFEAETFTAWRDRTAREAAFRAAGEGEEKGKAIQAAVSAFLDKARGLPEDDYVGQSDTLFEELAEILARAQPKPIREIAETRAAEQLEYLVRSERILAVIDAKLKAAGG